MSKEKAIKYITRAKELSKIRKILEEKEKLAHSVLKDTKSLDSDASQLVDEHFWDLVK